MNRFCLWLGVTISFGLSLIGNFQLENPLEENSIVSRTEEFSSKSVESKQDMIYGRYTSKLQHMVYLKPDTTKKDLLYLLHSFTDDKSTDGSITSTDDDGVIDIVHSEIIVDSEKYHSSIMQVKPSMKTKFRKITIKVHIEDASIVLIYA